jgi:hypothetical protein
LRKSKLGATHPETLESLGSVASCLLAAGRASEAVPLSRQAAEAWEKLNRSDPASLYRAASFRAICASALRTADNSTASTRDADREVDRAIGWLKKAIDAGFKNVPQMKRDPHLQSLRERDDFKNLLTRIDASTKSPKTVRP